MVYLILIISGNKKNGSCNEPAIPSLDIMEIVFIAGTAKLLLDICKQLVCFWVAYFSTNP